MYRGNTLRESAQALHTIPERPQSGPKLDQRADRRYGYLASVASVGGRAPSRPAATAAPSVPATVETGLLYLRA